MAVIVVVGEALVDLVIGPGGDVTAALGGAPFNTARACGRLGADVSFVAAVSVDRFGSMLVAQLEADGVSTDHVARVDVPTTLAAAELDEHGAAQYRFYIQGTSAPMLSDPPLDLGGEVLFTGGLGLVLEPMAEAVERMVVTNHAHGLVMIDVNCRPRIIPDRDAYVERVQRVVSHAHIVKVSDEDLAYLWPDDGPVEAARLLLRRGPRAVLLTAGGDGVRILTAEAEELIPVQPVEVMDTIGAGDSFGGGFLSAWIASGARVDQAGDVDRLRRSVEAANVVAGIVCTRRGADPPWRSELADTWPD